MNGSQFGALTQGQSRRQALRLLAGGSLTILGVRQVGVALAVAGQAPGYSLVDLGLLGGRSSEARGLNDHDQIVGTINSDNGSIDAFLWQGNEVTLLSNPLGGPDTYAEAINNAGQIAGTVTTVDLDSHAARWENGVMTDLGTLGGSYSNASSINDAGDIVGYSATVYGANHAFIWRNGHMSDLGTLGGKQSVANGINDAGDIVGFAEDVHGVSHAVRWHEGTIADLDIPLGKGSTSTALKINDAGQIIGGTETFPAATPGTFPDITHRSFVWEKGQVTDLGTLGGKSSDAAGINNGGQIVGFSTKADGVSYAFLWQDGSMIQLPGLRAGAESIALRINDVGTIVGEAAETPGKHAGDEGTHAVMWRRDQSVTDGRRGMGYWLM